MAFITREDGVNFVIPSYREVLTAKQKSAIKSEVETLSESYGEYITMQEKGDDKYEVAFSTDIGYLLGETVWYFFDRPADLIYCENVPGKDEAILVIVKDGSVYLDGRFALESIPEELITLLTQQNNFDIYIYGDVPISEMPTDGKFSFEASSVKSFNVLTEPAFASLPLLKPYHLEPVRDVLKAHGVGVLPLKQLGIVLAVGVVGWIGYNIATREAEKPQEVVMEPNPFEGYVNSLNSPSPNEILVELFNKVSRLYSITGWRPKEINYGVGSVEAKMQSTGGTVQGLLDWCNQNDGRFNIKPTGIFVSQAVAPPNRAKPKWIYPIKDTMATLLDNIIKVYPKADKSGVSIQINKVTGPYTSYKVSVTLANVTPSILLLFSNQLGDLPITLDSVKFSTEKVFMNGSITLTAMGN